MALTIALGCFLAAGLAALIVTLRYLILEYRRDRIPVLIYHRIVSDEDISRCRKSSYVVSATSFGQQMLFLKERGYTTMDLNDYLYYKEHPQQLPQKPVIISFDDGYENNYIHAYPVLKKHGFKAVVYSIADPASPIFPQFEIPERLMSPEQMKELSENGISIQGHTATHPHLKDLADADIYRELHDCRQRLEAITGKPVVHMAVPYGSMDGRLFSIAREAGYKTLSIPGKGTVNLATDPYDIKRLSIHSTTTMEQFARLVSSPAYIVLNRVYAASHLLIRRIFGQDFEKKLKIMFAQFGLDDAEKLAKIGFALVIVAALIFLLLYI
jgi:peptidoglycan/xylan/chitin deacetylase (PgdA/CDA1 family)